VISTLDPTIDHAAHRITQNRNTRPSALFRYVRGMRCNQCFGDYPLMATIVRAYRAQGVMLNRGQIYRMVKQSDDLRPLPGREIRHIVSALEKTC